MSTLVQLQARICAMINVEDLSKGFRPGCTDVSSGSGVTFWAGNHTVNMPTFSDRFAKKKKKRRLSFFFSCRVVIHMTVGE